MRARPGLVLKSNLREWLLGREQKMCEGVGGYTSNKIKYIIAYLY
jgi:hypothetical protein